MISIPQKVEVIVNESPYLREAISDDLINLSALARKIQPQIAKELMKPVSKESVFMALQRYQKSLKPYTSANPGKFLGNLTLRSDLFEITIKNSDTLTPRLAAILQSVEHDRSRLFVFTQGIYETTVIASRSLEFQVTQALKEEQVTDTVFNLTAISLQRMHDHIEAIGVLMYPLRIVAWQGISVIEIVTTLNELMIIVRDKDIDKAVVAIRQALQSAAESQEETESK